MSTSRTRVALADDDVLLREGLASLLERSGLEVVGQAGNASQLLALVRRHDGNMGSWAQVIRQARCTDSSLDADEWFPVAAETRRAQQEAAAAIAICQACPVRRQCLAFSLRHWEVGRYGVWGGTVEAERASLRRRMLADSTGAPRRL